MPPAAHLPCHGVHPTSRTPNYPLYSAAFPPTSFILGSVPLKVPITADACPSRPPPPPPPTQTVQKGTPASPHLTLAAPAFLSSNPSPQRCPTEHLRLPCRRPASGEQPIGFLVLHFPSPAPWPSARSSRVAVVRASVSSTTGNGRRSFVDFGSGGPRLVDWVHGFFNSKIFPKPIMLATFEMNPLYLSNIKPQSTVLLSDPRNSKIIPYISVATFYKLLMGLYTFFSSYLCNRDSKSSDSCAKILRITSYFILYILLIYVVAFIDWLCLLRVR
jgi:hypothetical protein